MQSYIISYDLKNQKINKSLYKTIKSYGTWAHISKSTWAVSTNSSAKQIRDHLSSVMDDDDSIFVVKSGVESAWKNATCKNQWLKDNL
jgi:CRISPR-associated endonuclease Cas2